MRLIINFFLLFSVISVLSCKYTDNDVNITPNVDSPPNDFISYYSFNGNPVDSKNSQSAGIIYGAKLMDDKKGNSNSAYYFDGNAHIELPIPEAKNTYTYSFWAKATSTPFPGTIGAAISVGSVGGDQLVNTANDYYGVSGWALTSYNSDGTNLGLNTGTVSSLSVGKWVHLVLSRDSKNFKAYADGQLLGVLPTNDKTPGYGYDQPKFYVGSRHSGQGFVGLIDEIKIFDRVLSDEEVKKLYTSY